MYFGYDSAQKMVAGVFLVCIFAVAIYLEWKRRTTVRLDRVAERLSLGLKNGKARGQVDGRPVQVDVVGEKVKRVTVTVECTASVPRSLLLRPETQREKLQQRVAGAADVLIGDPAFDAAIRFEGKRADLLRLLDANSRSKVKDLVSRHQLEVSRGRVIANMPSARNETKEVVRTIRAAAELANLLRSGRDPGHVCLFERATQDREEQVAYFAAVALFETYPRSKSAPRLARILRRSDHVHLRVLSAAQLEDEALLSGVATDDETEAEWRALALLKLHERFPDGAFAIAREIGGTPHPELNQALLAVAEGRDDDERLAFLGELAMATADSQLARMIATSLNKEPGPQNNPILRALVRVEDESVRREAAVQLGEHGELEDVALLQEALRLDRMGAESKNALQAAVHAIQQRSGTAESTGGLTIAEDFAAGALSDAKL